MTFDPARPATAATLAVSVVTAVGGAVVLAVSVRVGGLESTAGALQLTVALQTVGIVALLAAATLLVSRCRVDGGAPSAHVAVALVVYALGLPLGGIVASVAPLPARAVQDEAVCLAATVIVVGLCVAAVRDHDRPAPSARALAVRVLVVLAVCATSLLLLDRALVAGAGRVDLGALAFGLDITAGLLWLGLVAVAWRRRAGSPWVLRGATVAAGFVVVRGLDAASADVVGSAAHLGATLLGACLAALVGWCALSALAEAIETARRHAQVTARRLDEATGKVLARDAWREELNHDAVNAISGLRAALSVMARRDGLLDAPAAQRLLDAALAEVAHLEHLVVRSTHEGPVVFDVAEVVAAVVETRRAHGLVVEVGVGATGLATGGGEVLAVGRPGDLATVLHNLLVNAHVHAPGSRVRIDLSRGPDQVGVSVLDDGPGIAGACRSRAFERGVRGPTSTSTGLGLYVARELMREQGGDLELVRSVAGCHVVATLPAACGPTSSRTVPPVRMPADAPSAGIGA